jgi:hypothetical protein
MNIGPSPQERVASWRREQQHWPWVGDWPKMEKAAIQGEMKGLSPHSPQHEGGEACDFSKYYAFQSINLAESDLRRYPDRTPRKAAMFDIDDEMSYEDGIRLSFIRFDRFEAWEKKISPYEASHVDSGRDFLASKFDCYYEIADGKTNKIKCSILDRERGYINEPGDLTDELSYPMLCIYTLDDIPHIGEPVLSPFDEERMSVSEEYTNEELAKVFKIFNKKHNMTLPKTAKTIKKLRDNPPSKGFIPYPWQHYEGTPIGKLLKDHPKAGRAALSNLHNYFIMWVFEGKRWCMCPREPTRGQMIIGFMESPRLRGVIFPKRDLAEKQFDLLVDYGIIKGWKGYTNQKHVIYYATQKSGPHKIPAGPRRNTREYYILNNK